MRRHSGISKWQEAQAIASDYRLVIRKVVIVRGRERSEAYHVSRRMRDGRSVYVGQRSSVDGLLSLVQKAAGAAA